MFISILITFFTLISLWFIGFMISVSIKNKKALNFINPFTGIILVLNVVYLLNLSKISISKPFFDLQLLNGVWFLFFILILIFIFSLLNSSFKRAKSLKEEFLQYLKFSVIVGVLTPLFLNKLGDSSISIRASELKDLSIVHNMLSSLSKDERIWQTGVSILTATHSEIFKISTLDSTKILHGISIFLTIYILIYFVAKILKPKRNFLRALFVILIISSLLILINASLTFSFIVGSLLFLVFILFAYLEILYSKSKKQLVYIEEFLIAFSLIFIASINSLAFKLSIFALMIIFLNILFLNGRNKALTFLKPLLIALLINPLLLGFALLF